MTTHQVTLFFSESPTNPYLRCVDVAAIAQLCHAKGAFVCIDSTFATPINSRWGGEGAPAGIERDRPPRPGRGGDVE